MLNNTITSPIESLVDSLAEGSMLIMADDENRENEGDIIAPAQSVTPEMLAFMMKHARGLICLSMDANTANKAGIIPANRKGSQIHSTAFGCSIDLKGHKDGESAKGRHRTIKKLLDPDMSSKDFHSPGSIYPVIAKDGGVLVRAGHTEASVDLATLAGMSPVAVICEIMLNDGTMACLEDLNIFAKQHNLRLGTVADLIAFRASKEQLVSRTRVHNIVLPNMPACKLYCYHCPFLDGEQLAILFDDDTSVTPLMRVEVQQDTHRNIASIAIHSRLHDNHHESDSLQTRTWMLDKNLHKALHAIAQRRHGAFISLNSGGLHAKKPSGELEIREHGIGAQIIRDLGFREMDFLVKSSIDPVALSGFGIHIKQQIHLDQQ